MPLECFANPRDLTEWSPGAKRSRWDYDAPDHTLDEMIEMGDRYFTNCVHMLRALDLVYVTDASAKRATIVINLVDRVRNTVIWDIDVAHAEHIVMPKTQALAIRWRGPRGGRFAIVDKDGAVVAKDMQSREEAERRLAMMTEARAA
jgi:hypothetical protein